MSIPGLHEPALKLQAHTQWGWLAEMLLGQDPLNVEAHWERLYVGSAMNGRRGAVINAMGALDIALHDLRGKALGKPYSPKFRILKATRVLSWSGRWRLASGASALLNWR